MGVGSVARKPFGQQIAYQRTRVLGAAGNQTVSLGWYPAGANVVRVTGNARTVFSGGTPALTLGSRASPANLIATAVALITTANPTAVQVLQAGAHLDADTELVAVISGVPTAGIADITVEYTVPDETP